MYGWWDKQAAKGPACMVCIAIEIFPLPPESHTFACTCAPETGNRSGIHQTYSDWCYSLFVPIPLEEGLDVAPPSLLNALSFMKYGE